MYRTALADDWLVEGYGTYNWFDQEFFDANGDKSGEYTENGFEIGAELKYFITPSASTNLDVQYRSYNTDTQNDNTDTGFSSLRADLGFSIYF